MKRTSLIAGLLLLALSLSSHAQTQMKPFNPNDIEVGIVEKLDSIIPLDLSFVNQNGEPVVLREFINKPTVLSFVYFDCPGACPPLMAGLADVLGKTDMKLGEDYQVLTFSFDPSDTPEKALKTRANYIQLLDEAVQPFWNFLTTDQETIKKITEGVGWRYKPQGVDFAHPSAIMVVSPEGKLTRYLYGTQFLPFDLKMALIEAKKGQSQPTINKVLSYCFSYDPQGRAYTLQITRVAATLIILFAVILFGVLLIRGRKKTEKK